MMRFTTLLKHPAEWMTDSSAEGSVVLTSRIRLARNISKKPFPGWSRKQDRVELLEELKEEVESLPEMENAFSQELSELTSFQKQVLVERHLISREQAARGAGSAAVVNRNQTLSIMINEEDHLRLQSIRSGLQLRTAYDALLPVDTALEKSLNYAFDTNLGYITACPTNLGTGLRASAMLHLPGLAISDQIGKVVQGIAKLGLAVRGIFGEGTESLGHLFQISNQSTLGESENAIIERLERVIGRICTQERNARQKLVQENPEMLLDQVSRSYGVLKNAYIMDSKEALNHLSLIRMGADFGFFEKGTMSLCDTLIMEIEPAHLQYHAKCKLNSGERDTLRAEIIRSKLQSLPPADISSIKQHLTPNILPPS